MLGFHVLEVVGAMFGVRYATLLQVFGLVCRLLSRNMLVWVLLVITPAYRGLSDRVSMPMKCSSVVGQTTPGSTSWAECSGITLVFWFYVV